MFQSSPSGEAGCYEEFEGDEDLRSGFNPHPAVKLGATGKHEKRGLNTLFQSSPSGEAGCYDMGRKRSG